MKPTKKTKPSKITFQNREKEAKFWEENFKDEFAAGKQTEVDFAKNLSETINIRLDPETIATVRSKARAKGLGPTQLIRMWILEKLG